MLTCDQTFRKDGCFTGIPGESAVGMVGPRGQSGEKGNAGLPGYPGPIGPTGFSGIKGNTQNYINSSILGTNFYKDGNKILELSFNSFEKRENFSLIQAKCVQKIKLKLKHELK